MVYIGVKFLWYTEAEVWKKTPYQITTLFKIHAEFNPRQFKPTQDVGDGDIDAALGGF